MIHYKLNNRTHSFEPYDYIIAVYLFGSYVSGGYQKTSDIDHLIIISDAYREKRSDIRQSLASQLKLPSKWLAVYTMSEFSGRCREGEYFFWAIKLNHKLIYTETKETDEILRRMPIYRTVRKTMLEDKEYHDTTLALYKNGDAPNAQVISCLTHVIRDACINILYMHGIIDFGKLSSVRRCGALYDVHLPFDYQHYVHLYDAHLKVSDNLITYWSNTYLKLHYFTLDYEKKALTKDFKSPLRKYKPS